MLHISHIRFNVYRFLDGAQNSSACLLPRSTTGVEYYQANGGQYFVVDNLAGWYEAREHCVSIGMEIARVDSEEKHAELLELLKLHASVYWAHTGQEFPERVLI